MCLGTGREAKDVGISTIEGRDARAHCRGRGGARKVSAMCDGDGDSETDGSLVLPEILRPAPGEGISKYCVWLRLVFDDDDLYWYTIL